MNAQDIETILNEELASDSSGRVRGKSRVNDRILALAMQGEKNISSNSHVVGSSIEYMNKLQNVAAVVSSEVVRAKTMFPNNFVNQHEAYAVILEEVDELWDEIKKNQRNYDLDAQRKEATQAAAMLFRLLVELL